LAEARERRDNARKLPVNDTNPALVKAVNKQVKQQAAKNL